MRHGARSKSIIYALVLAIGMSLLFPEGAFSASRSFRGQENLGVPRCTAGIVSKALSAQVLALSSGECKGCIVSEILSTAPVFSPELVVGLGSLEGTS